MTGARVVRIGKQSKGVVRIGKQSKG